MKSIFRVNLSAAARVLVQARLRAITAALAWAMAISAPASKACAQSQQQAPAPAVNGFATVQAVSSNTTYGNLPVINLGSRDVLHVSFDDLLDRDLQLRYRVIQVSTDGTPTQVKEIEYFNGINKTDIEGVEYSFNTRSNYIHYSFDFPQKGRGIKLSGAYQFEIFEAGNEPGPVGANTREAEIRANAGAATLSAGAEADKVLLRIPFMVTEANLSTEVKVKPPTRVDKITSGQELELKLIVPPALRLIQPEKCLQVYVQQNLNTSTLRRLPLSYQTGGELYYKDRPEELFDGINEFRNLDLRPLRHAGRGVEYIQIADDRWHAQTPLQKSREYLPYLNEDDINGNYVIKADNTENSDIEAEYLTVHFLLQEEPRLGREIYVIGKFNDWRCNERSRMQYNPSLHAYTLSLLLKQGFYDYMFAWEENARIHLPYFEGSHYDTKNDYYIYVFYSEPGSRYPRLLCVKKAESRK